jgi:aryl-alcohol dehydrogenase-like predicted oxidoreductase
MKLDLSKLALGSVQFGLDYGINNANGVVQFEEVKRILDVAFSNNILTIDTARSYGNSETVLGQFNLNDWQIVSKFSSKLDENSMENEYRLSTKHLQLEKLYGYIAHSAEILIENPKYWSQLKLLKEQGLVSRIGFSIYKTEQLEKLLDLGCIPDLVQVQYNLLDRRFEPVFEPLKKLNCEIHTRSAFLQGLFFKEEIPDYFLPIKSILKEIQFLYPNRFERAAFLIAFCMQNPFVDKVVIGVQSAKELQDNIDALLTFNPQVNSQLALPNFDSEIVLPYNWPKTK